MTRIAVYADWAGLEAPRRLGILHARRSATHELFEFEYDNAALADPHLNKIQLDPRIFLFEGHQYPEQGRETFGMLADSSPDRWGCMLMSRRLEREKRAGNVSSNTSLFESDFLLGVHDAFRIGALRFKRNDEAKPIEFGHMILLQQVEEKFITGYQVFEHRPNDASLVDSILKRHQKTFGQLPESFTADKGFYQSMEKLRVLERTIPNVSIAKKGPRTEAETAREHHPIFRALQRFRAGIEGTISALKRVFKLSRCLYRSFRTFCSSVGAHVFAHNLVVLARN